jgi:hypothetical protein
MAGFMADRPSECEQDAHQAKVWLQKFWDVSMMDFFADQGFIPATGVNIRGQRTYRHVVGEGNSPARGVHQ